MLTCLFLCTTNVPGYQNTWWYPLSTNLGTLGSNGQAQVIMDARSDLKLFLPCTFNGKPLKTGVSLGHVSIYKPLWLQPLIGKQGIFEPIYLECIFFRRVCLKQPVSWDTVFRAHTWKQELCLNSTLLSNSLELSLPQEGEQYLTDTSVRVIGRASETVANSINILNKMSKNCGSCVIVTFGKYWLTARS